jgi:rRNA maturation endonuclease Nob1
MNIDQAQMARVLAQRLFVSVCAGCGAILRVRKDVSHCLSHDICDACAQRLYPEYAKGAVA